MNRYIIIIFSLWITTSCTQYNSIEGIWKRNLNEQIINPFFPYELSFHHDTLSIFDDYNFKQVARFETTNDSLSITFENNIKANYSFSSLSDSTILISGIKFLKTKEADLTQHQPYTLLGYTSKNKFKPDINSSFINLIKDKDSARVILNSTISNLDELPKYLSHSHGTSQAISVYLGKGIELKDLIEMYCWLKFSGSTHVTLITANKGFEEFNSVQDYVSSIDQQLFLDFIHQYQLPPPLPHPALNNDTMVAKNLYIKNGTDLKQMESIENQVYYNVLISNQVSMADYLKLREKINQINAHEKRIRAIIGY